MTERCTKALAVDTTIRKRFFEFSTKFAHLIHRAQILLKDSMEWDFAFALLKEDEYMFQHILSNVIGQFDDFRDDYEPVTFVEAIQLLRAASLVSGKIEESRAQGKDIRDDDEEFRRLYKETEATIPKRLTSLFGLIPMLLHDVARSAHRQGYLTEMDIDNGWSVKVIDKAIDTFQYANRLLLGRGLGDRQ